MEEKIFPFISKEQRRDGKTTGLTLLKGNNTGHTHEYRWLIDGGVNGGAAVSFVHDIEQFGTMVKLLRDYEECLQWSSE